MTWSPDGIWSRETGVLPTSSPSTRTSAPSGVDRMRIAPVAERSATSATAWFSTSTTSRLKSV